MAGFISLYRDIRDHWIWESERPRTKLEAWIDILMLVNFAEGKHVVGNETKEVLPGSQYVTIRQLSKRWKWSTTKVVNFLNLLKKENMIFLENNTKKKTLLTVVNWELYQIDKDTKKTQERQRKDTKKTLNNKENKENNNIYTPEFENWYSSWPRQQAKLDSFKNFEKRRKEHGLDFILLCSKNYLDSLSEDKKEFVYASNNFFGQKAYYLDHAESKPKNKTNVMLELGFEDCDVY